MAPVTEFLFELLLPPRRTEQLVRSITKEFLSLLAGDGPLPYRDSRVKALVWELKYRKNPLALSLAAYHVYGRILGEAEETLGVPLLIPIPMYKNRKRARGYNQCELLCEALVKESGGALLHAPQVLARVRNTPPQQGLPRAYRLKNVEHSMAVIEPENIRGRTCIVIDDVETTGATKKEAARALTAAGAGEVIHFSLARS